MKEFVCLLIVVSIPGLEGTCDINKASNCTGFTDLSFEPLGLMKLDRTNRLCRTIDHITECLNRTVGGCPATYTVSWLPVVKSAGFICENRNEYLKSIKCYYQKDINQNILTCSQSLSNNLSNCSDFDKFKKCIRQSVDGCKDNDFLSRLVDVFTLPHRKILDCPLLAAETQTQTTVISSTLLQKDMPVPSSTTEREIVVAIAPLLEKKQHATSSSIGLQINDYSTTRLLVMCLSILVVLQIQN